MVTKLSFSHQLLFFNPSISEFNPSISEFNPSISKFNPSMSKFNPSMSKFEVAKLDDLENLSLWQRFNYFIKMCEMVLTFGWWFRLIMLCSIDRYCKHKDIRM